VVNRETRVGASNNKNKIYKFRLCVAIIILFWIENGEGCSILPALSDETPFVFSSLHEDHPFLPFLVLFNP
jgi:hypothetical protein